MILFFSAAIAALPPCDALYDADPADPAVWDCVVGQARAGRMEDALAFAEAVQASDDMTPQAWLTTGNLYRMVGDERVLDAYAQAAHGFERADDLGGQVKARMNWATVLRQYGDVAAGREQLERAQGLATGQEPYVTMVRIERARWACDLGGDYAAALADLNASRPRLDDPDFPDHGKLLIHHSSACLAERLGRTEQSRAHYHDLLAFTEQTGNDFVHAVTLDNLLWTEAMNGYDSADLLPRAHAALELALELGHGPTVADLTCLVAHLSPDASFDECLARADAADDGPIRSRAYGLAAERALSAGQLERARALLDAASDSVRESTDYGARIEWLAVEARYADAATPESAIDAGSRTLDAVGALRDLQPDRLVRSRTTTPYADLYAEQATRYRATGDLAGALAVIERLRGRQVLERLDRAAATPALIPSTQVWQARDDLLARIETLSASPDQADAFQAAIAEERAQRAEIFAATPAFARLRLPNVDIAAVQEALQADEAAVVPVRGEPSWAMVVRHNQLDVADLPALNGLADSARTFASLVEQGDPLVPVLTERFRDALITPIAQTLQGTHHLILVPDPSLHSVPWQTLVPDGMSVSITPSLRTLADLRGIGSVSGGPALLIADPAEGQAVASERRTPLGSLPGAVQEVQAVSSSLLGPTTLLIGADATESAVRSALASPVRLLHIAAHAVIDPVDPGKTAVVLSQSPHADGLLTVDEVVRLDLTGAIVVLSGCRTADGEVHADGIVGLTDAFLIAGARAVVASVVPLPDQDASRTLIAMHTALAQGARLDDALAIALREHPTAGLRVVGDGSATLPGRPKHRVPPWIWPLGALVLAGLAVSALWRRHR